MTLSCAATLTRCFAARRRTSKSSACAPRLFSFRLSGEPASQSIPNGPPPQRRNPHIPDLIAQFPDVHKEKYTIVHCNCVTIALGDHANTRDVPRRFFG